MTQAPITARLHVLMARDAAVGVVFRRGPSKLVCSMLWDRQTDRFSLGQWFKGRIYAERSDLSPDGRHLLYCAMDTRQMQESIDGWPVWTALSKAPWLSAIDLYGRSDTWGGGGVFLSNEEYRIDGAHDACLRRNSGLTRRLLVYDADPDPRSARLLRDGWTKVGDGKIPNATQVQRPLPSDWFLSLTMAGLRDRYELVQGDRRIPSEGWEWADRDGESVVWAEGGKLWRASLSEDGLTGVRELYDFNGMTFEARVAPY